VLFKVDTAVTLKLYGNAVSLFDHISTDRIQLGAVLMLNCWPFWWHNENEYGVFFNYRNDYIL